MKKRLTAFTLVMAIFMGLLGGCATGSENTTAGANSATDPATNAATQSSGTSAAKIRIGFSTKAQFSPFFAKMQETAKAYASELGIEVLCQAPDVETNITAQVEIIENFISNGVDAIVMAPCDAVMLNSTILKANKAGIPVILINDSINAQDLQQQGGDYITYVGVKQYDAAALAGKWVAENYPDGAKVCIIDGVLGVDLFNQRLSGFTDQLTGKFEVLGNQPADAERNKAFDVMQNFLTAFPKIDVVFASCDEMALGAAEAIEQAGRTGEIAVIGFDGNDDALEALRDAKLSADVVQDAETMATLAIDAAMDTLQGKSVDKEIYSPTYLVTTAQMLDMTKLPVELQERFKEKF